jgi:hypothetical protein
MYVAYLELCAAADEDENSQASDDDGDSEVEERSAAEEDSASEQVVTEDGAESITNQSNATQPSPTDIPAKSDDQIVQPEVNEKEPESKIEESETTTTASSSKKDKPAKEDGIYDLLTQTIEALKIT